MLVQNQNDLRVANRMYGRKLPTFGYADRNDEYAQYWRKLIKSKWPERHQSRWNKKVILSWIKLARTADLHARNEKKWRA